jgi:hypothetical protein
MDVISAVRFGSFLCAAAYGFVMLGGDGWPRGGDNDAGMVSTGPGDGHLDDGTPERQSLRSRDLWVDVDLDTGAAIRGESSCRRWAQPGMRYRDRHQSRAHRGH